MNEKLKEYYNTDVVGSYKFKLLGMGYVSITKMLLTKSEKKHLIDTARKGRNNLALSNGNPVGICVRQDFYNKFVLENAADQISLDIKIISDNAEFITKLMKFLAKNNNVDFAIVLNTNSEYSRLDKNKIEFLCSTISDINFDSRVSNCLKSHNIQYVFQILEYGKSLLNLANFGEGSMSNVKFVFKQKGLNFNMVPQEFITYAKSRCETKLIVK